MRPIQILKFDDKKMKVLSVSQNFHRLKYVHAIGEAVCCVSGPKQSDVSSFFSADFRFIFSHVLADLLNSDS